jgi:hypothetical protein
VYSQISAATLNLRLILLDMWIHESCLHSPLWDIETKNAPSTLTAGRLRMLHSTMTAMKSYFNTLMDMQEQSLYYLALPTWAGWFYANIIACKLVFLKDSERPCQANGQEVPETLRSLLPENFGDGAPHDFCSLSSGNAHVASWEPTAVAKESEAQELFVKLINKLSFSLPKDTDLSIASKGDRDPLCNIACLQNSLLSGFTKRMKEHTASLRAMNALLGTPSDITPTSIPASDPETSPEQISQATIPRHASAGGDPSEHFSPFLASLNFNTMNFDGMGMPTGHEQQDAYADWMWDLMMDDFIPPI